MKKQGLFFPLDLQLFAEPGENGGSNGDGGEQTISKALYDKSVSDLSKKNKELERQLREIQAQLNGKLSDEERMQREYQEREARFQALERENKLNKVEKKLLQGGFSGDEMSSLATAIVDGNIEEVTSILGNSRTTLVSGYEQKIKEMEISKMGSPTGSNGGSTPTLSDYYAMTVDERIALRMNNPKLFEEIQKSKNQ